MTELTEEQEDEIGLRVLKGETATKVAREFRVDANTASLCALRYVQSMEGYELRYFLEALRIDGIGRIRAARIIYERLVGHRPN